MKKKTVEKINIFASLSAIIISVLSFCFSYYTYHEANIEKVTMSSIYVHEDYLTKPVFYNDSVVIIPTYWQIILSNNGDKTLSITKSSVETANDKSVDAIISHVFDGIYENIDQYDKNKLEFPVIINSGESKKFYLRVGVMCDLKASKLLIDAYELKSELFKKGRWLQTKELNNFLAKNNLDIYGNKTNPTIENGKIVGWESDIEKQKEYIFTVKSAKGNSFNKSIYSIIGEY